MCNQHRAWRLTMRQTAFYAVLPVLLSCVRARGQLADVVGGGLVNPDSFMRLVRLRQLLADPVQSHVVMRDGSGLGTVIHWSHLIDSLICLAATPLTLFIPLHDALHVVAVLFGPLSMAAAGVAIAWAAAPFVDRGWLWLAPVGLVAAQAVVTYGIPGVVHHHVPAVVVAIMTAGWAGRICLGGGLRHGGWRLGGWAAVGIWLTPETLVTSMMAFGTVWVAWIVVPHGRRIAMSVRDTGVTFLAVVALAWLVDPPHGGYTIETADRLSIVFVALGAALAAIGAVVLLTDEITDRPAQRLAVTGCAAIMILATWTALFPCLSQVTRSLMGAEEWQAMLGDVSEMQPLTTLSEWLGHALSGSIATALAAWIAWRRSDAVLWFVALCAAALVVLGWMQVRFAAYPETLAAAMLPVGLTLLSRHAVQWPALRQAAVRMALVAAFLLGPLAGHLPGITSPARAAQAEVRKCTLSKGVALLEGVPPQVVLTDVNDAPELLYRTGMRTVGSLYHRNPAGFMRLRSAWRTQANGAVPAAFTVANVGLVLFCPQPVRSPLLRGAPDDTVMDRLARNDPPAWLLRLRHDAASGYTLFKVQPRLVTSQTSGGPL